MISVTKQFLSAQTDGQPINVAATADPGTLIHTVPSSVVDEIWLYAHNYSGADKTVTVELGGNGSHNKITTTVVKQTGLVLLLPGLILAAAATVKVFAADGTSIGVVGFVNRIA